MTFRQAKRCEKWLGGSIRRDSWDKDCRLVWDKGEFYLCSGHGLSTVPYKPKKDEREATDWVVMVNA